MATEEFDLDLSGSEMPEAVAALIRESDRRIDRFFETEQNRRYPLFVPSDPRIHFAALDFVTRHDLPLGRVYCEWGSGFGVGACLASLLGYEAYGIEIEPALIDISEKLAADLEIPAKYCCSNYLPEGYDSYEGIGGEVLLEPDGFVSPGEAAAATPAYEGMEYPIEEIDLFYVYPRPDDQDFMLKMFDALAGEGAILLAYYSEKEICGYRRVHRD